MSTKIYDAYRIPKSRDILKDLKKAKEIATEYIANNESYLKYIHASTMFQIAEEIKNNPKSKAYYQSAIDDNKKGKLDNFAMMKILEKNSLSLERSSVSVELSSSIFYDDDYWYIKFFVNDNIQSKILKKIEKELDLEDFHYQNQVDPPEDVPYEEFEAREEKWEELLESSDGNYLDGFIYNIFDANQFNKLLTKYHYTGEKDLYKHLAYKFDHVYNIEKEIRKQKINKINKK